MRVLIGSFSVGLLAAAVPAFAADQVTRLDECGGLSIETFRQAAEYALTNRRYNIEENTPTLVVGEQVEKRVEILIEPGKVTIRWKEGWGANNDRWLRNVKADMLWRLAD